MKTTGYILMIAVSAAFAGCGSAPSPEIIAHRGASYNAPENTVASTLLAWEQDADAVECDIYLSADSRIMVMHDANTKRTTGADYTIADTSSDILRGLDAGSFKGKDYDDEKIPFLEEIIEAVPGDKRLFIEIKCGPEVIPALEDVISESGRIGSVTIITFSYETAVETKHMIPEVPVYWLASAKKDETTGEPIPYGGDLIAQALDGGLDGLDLHFGGMSEGFVRMAHEKGLGIFVWTVNDNELAAEMAAMGVNGITTDKPSEIRKHLQN